jgi:hypothetical protein
LLPYSRPQPSSCPALGSSEGQAPIPSETKPLHSTIVVKKTFTPQLASIIRQYRKMVVSQGLWRKKGQRTFRAPAIRYIASNLPMSAPPPEPNGPRSAGTKTSVTYHISVTMTDVSRSDGSQTITQTIITTGDDGTSYSDVITHTQNANGDTTETQNVSFTDDQGHTTTEQSDSESSSGGGFDPCYGLFCAENSRCCLECPKSPQCGIE